IPGNSTNVECDSASAECIDCSGGATGSYSPASTSVGMSLCTASLKPLGAGGTPKSLHETVVNSSNVDAAWSCAATRVSSPSWMNLARSKQFTAAASAAANWLMKS